jgi:hypothetical protein
MTERESRLLTLIAQAILTMELTMREQIDALVARVSEVEAAVGHVAQVLAAIKAERDAALSEAADNAALKAQLDELAARLSAVTGTLNAQ